MYAKLFAWVVDPSSPWPPAQTPQEMRCQVRVRGFRYRNPRAGKSWPRIFPRRHCMSLFLALLGGIESNSPKANINTSSVGCYQRPSLPIAFRSATVNIARSGSSSPMLKSNICWYILSRAVTRLAEKESIRSFVSLIFLYLDSLIWFRFQTSIN